MASNRVLPQLERHWPRKNNKETWPKTYIPCKNEPQRTKDLRVKLNIIGLL